MPASDPASEVNKAVLDVQWGRVILDEAHVIRNRNTKTHKAAKAVRTRFRWCVTGTPLQNKADDMQVRRLSLHWSSGCEVNDDFLVLLLVVGTVQFFGV